MFRILIAIVSTIVGMDVLMVLAELSNQTLFVSAVSALSAVIIVLYFRSEAKDKSHQQEVRDMSKTNVEMAGKFVDMAAGLKGSIDGLKENVKQNTEMFGKVHERIIESLNR